MNMMNFKKLKILDLGKNGLNDFPSKLCYLSKLEILKLFT